MKRVVYVNFRGKKVVPKGFRVDKENDGNLRFRKLLEADRALFAEKKYELPSGPNCPKDEDIVALVSFAGRFLHEDSEQGKKMTAVFEHLETCERCDALCRKTLIEIKYQNNTPAAGNNGRTSPTKEESSIANPTYVDFKKNEG